jgi:hypothetical protein
MTSGTGEICPVPLAKLLIPSNTAHPSPPGLSWPPPYCGLGSGAAHASLDLIGHIDPQVGVGCVKPAGLLLLLLLGMLSEGGDRATILFKHEGCDRGWDFHFTFVFGFLLDKGVAVCVACSIALKRTQIEPFVVEETHVYMHVCTALALRPLPFKGLGLSPNIHQTTQPLLQALPVYFSTAPSSKPSIKTERTPRTLWSYHKKKLGVLLLHTEL